MSRYSIGSLALLIFLAACGAAPTPTSTPISGAGEAAVALIQQQMYSSLTQQAIDNQAIQEGARQTATQQVVNSTATQQAHYEAAQATKRADSATQQAWQVTVSAAKTADAAGTQAAQAAATSTKEMQSTATAQQFLRETSTAEALATVTAEYQTAQAPIVAARATALDIETKKAALALRRAQDTYFLSAYGGWFFALFLAVAFGFFLWKKSQIGIIADESGKVRVVMIGKRALQPELMANPVLDFTDPARVFAPVAGISEEAQLRIVHAAKVVEAIGNLPSGYSRQALGMMAAGLTGQNSSPQVNIQVVSGGSVAPVLDEVEGGLLDDE